MARLCLRHTSESAVDERRAAYARRWFAQGQAEHIRVVEHPRLALRRIPPDAVQFQVILGSLLGDGRLVGLPRDRRLRIAHRLERSEYVRWKYERLGPFAAESPRSCDGFIGFDTVAHPLFDDLARLFHEVAVAAETPPVVTRLLRPLGLAVWLADLGRFDLRAETLGLEPEVLALAS